MFIVDWLTALLKASFQIVFAIVLSIPYYFAWNAVAPKYFTFLPEEYMHIPYWHVVGITLAITWVGSLVGKLTPKIVSISQNANPEINKGNK